MPVHVPTGTARRSALSCVRRTSDARPPSSFRVSGYQAGLLIARNAGRDVGGCRPHGVDIAWNGADGRGVPVGTWDRHWLGRRHMRRIAAFAAAGLTCVSPGAARRRSPVRSPHPHRTRRGSPVDVPRDARKPTSARSPPTRHRYLHRRYLHRRHLHRRHHRSRHHRSRHTRSRCLDPAAAPMPSTPGQRPIDRAHSSAAPPQGHQGRRAAHQTSRGTARARNW